MSYLKYHNMNHTSCINIIYISHIMCHTLYILCFWCFLCTTKFWQLPAIVPSPVFCACFSFSRFLAIRGSIALALALNAAATGLSLSMGMAGWLPHTAVFLKTGKGSSGSGTGKQYTTTKYGLTPKQGFMHPEGSTVLSGAGRLDNIVSRCWRTASARPRALGTTFFDTFKNYRGVIFVTLDSPLTWKKAARLDKSRGNRITDFDGEPTQPRKERQQFIYLEPHVILNEKSSPECLVSLHQKHHWCTRSATSPETWHDCIAYSPALQSCRTWQFAIWRLKKLEISDR